jgi:hypothetical protein
MKRDWYPNQDAKRAAFLENYVANMDKACGLLNVSTSTFADSIAAARAWIAAYDARVAMQKDLDTAVLAFQKQARATDQSVRAAAKQIKGIMGVPPEVLNLLELVGGGEVATTRVAAQAPRLEAIVELGTVVLKYRKLGHQAVLLYSCRTGEDAFSLLGTYTLNRIEDTRANLVPGQPEQRQYYAIYMDKDQPTGGQSATVSVVVGDKPVAALVR